jgi:hypothetical protein
MILITGFFDSPHPQQAVSFVDEANLQLSWVAYLYKH